MSPEYEQGWRDAFDALAKYIEAEVCPVTGQMIRRMKDETWRGMFTAPSPQEQMSDPPSEES